MDALTLSMIPSPDQYGKYRLWAGIALGLSAFGLGFLFDSLFAITVMFHFFSLFMGLLGAIWLARALKMACDRTHTQSAYNETSTNSSSQGVRSFLASILCTAFKLQIVLAFLVLGV